jgi:hypothetical protein
MSPGCPTRFRNKGIFQNTSFIANIKRCLKRSVIVVVAFVSGSDGAGRSVLLRVKVGGGFVPVMMTPMLLLVGYQYDGVVVLLQLVSRFDAFR